MRIAILPLLLSLLLSLSSAMEALAHGGVYRGPGGAVPPNQREPGDPTPQPPPPSRGEPPVTEGPTSKPGSGPTTPAPMPTPGSTPQTPAPGLNGKSRTGPRASLGLDSWMFWYENNKERYQALKKGIYMQLGSGNVLFGTGRVTTASRTSATHATRALVRSEVVPALLWAMDPENVGHQDTESAAYIALAKVTDEPAHVELLQKGVASGNALTSESAALALGLLRRDREADRFDAPTLDRARAFLFDVLEDDAQRMRTRAFAAMALGLLGDQPTGSAAGAGAAQTTARLFELLRQRFEHPDLPAAVVTAIGLQPTGSLTRDQRDVLRGCLTKGRLHRQDVDAFLASYATHALGRVGVPEKDARLLRMALGRRRGGAPVERSAAIALGTLARRSSAEERVETSRDLLRGVKRKRIRDLTARNFAVISLAYLVNADVRDRRTDVLGDGKVGDYLLDLAQNGRQGQRDFGALALGLVCREIGDTPANDLYGAFQARAREVLRNGLDARRVSARGRAAFAVALGLARDERSLPTLTKIVSDASEDDELRGYAAIAIGHVGLPKPACLAAIRDALESRRSDKLRRSAATALGMLHDKEAVPLLKRELKLARSQYVKGQVVMALAQVGDERAIEPLIEVLKDRREQDLTRAMACAGLGIVGDLEWIRSLARLSRDVNYRAAGGSMNEVLSIL